MLKMLREIGL